MSFTPSVIAVFGGIQFNKNVSIELVKSVASTSSRDNLDIGDELFEDEISIEDLTQIKITGILPIPDTSVDLYSNLVHSNIKLKEDIRITDNSFRSVQFSETSSDSDLGFGIGIRFGSEQLKGFVDYSSLYSEEELNVDTTITAFQAGIAVRF